MRHSTLALLPLFLAAAPGCAHADWIDPGLAYRCDAAAGEFGLAATMATSAPEMPGEVGVPAGYAPLSKEHDELAVSCGLGHAQASAAIHIIRAQRHGQCSSFEFVDLVRLQVDGKPLLEHTLFNGGCHSDPVLHRIEIRATGTALWLRTCRAPWDWATGYSPDVCEEREISSDGKAASN
ncbi:MAG: hypothetical protein JF586_14825 [Burkholderiales bacterium]|nr:hypothetical protein [Burkholderiales bacterium]